MVDFKLTKKQLLAKNFLRNLQKKKLSHSLKKWMKQKYSILSYLKK